MCIVSVYCSSSLVTIHVEPNMEAFSFLMAHKKFLRDILIRSRYNILYIYFGWASFTTSLWVHANTVYNSYDMGNHTNLATGLYSKM